MYFRFGVALLVVIACSFFGVIIEKENLRLQQQITRQHSRHDLLVEKIASARVESQRLGAPPQLLQAIEDGEIVLPTTQTPSRYVQTDDRDLN